MKGARLWAFTGSLGLVVSVVAATPAFAKPAPPRVDLPGSAAPMKARSHPDGSVSGASTVSFDLSLTLRNATGARRFLRQVSSPGAASFHHYLTDSQWVSRFGPTKGEVAKATSWLRSQGFKVGSVANDRLFVSATGTAATVEHAFGVQLGYYKVNGHRVRLAKGTLSVPSSLTGSVAGVVGVNQNLATTDLSQQGRAVAGSANQEPPPPAGFRNARPCSAYWGQKTDTADSGQLYQPYTYPQPYDICGYKPAQMRGAYGLAKSVAAGNDGSGVSVAIVDAYDSPTLLSDAQHYFRLNDPSHPLTSSQFTNIAPSEVQNTGVCGGSGWYPEQALDVESVHTMAPGAHIIFVGASDCFDNNLLAAVNTAITSGASAVSDSWGDDLGDLLTDAATRSAFDNTFLMAGATGVSVMFSSGDTGDNFADFGLTAGNFPSTDPYITSVGGTTLEIGANKTASAQYGWSTAKQTMCASTTTNCGSATTPAGSLAFQAGGGGGTSFQYGEPYYQDGVVPSALALRNENVTGAPMRVEPDIAMDADAQSGLLIGLTQTFPDGTYYDQFKEGGTSLASPLLAGVIADTVQKAGTPFGFLNPVLYKAYAKNPAAYSDIQAPANPDSAATVRVDYANSVDNSNGYVISLRAINYAGPETYCDTTGNCATRNVTLTATPGFDSLTGLGAPSTRFVGMLSKY
jgi:subtilase family serine protease